MYNLTRLILKHYLWICLACCTITASAQEDTSKMAIQAYEQQIPGTKVSFKMTPIPGGSFMMGSPETEADRNEDEGPGTEISLEGFWMGVHEVTFDEYEIYRQKELDKAPEGKEEAWNADAVTRPSPPYEDPTFGMGEYGYPAASMTQYAALHYCKWLTEKTGVFYRLPTEAEWEYACRAGTTTSYYFGDNVDSLDHYAWHYDNSDEAYHKVGSKKPNPWGLYDMHGNVAEWTLDQYTDDYFAQLKEKEMTSNPWIQPTKLHPRTVKGGSWDDEPEVHRSAARTESSMVWKRRDPQIPKSFWWNTDSPFVGFRIVRPFKQPTPEEVAQFWARTLDE